jgi:uncharacterized membrane protein YkoI
MRTGSHRRFICTAYGRREPGRRTQMTRRLVLILALVVAAAAIAGGIAIAAGTGDDDEPLTGSTLEQATEAALAHTGGGTVIETEVGDDGAAYGVEVRRADGRVVEVSLDENFKVVGTENDDDTAGEDDGPEDD